MDQAQNEEIDLFSVLQTIWDGKWKVIFFIFISLIAAISYTFNIPNSFKVETKLQKSDQDLYYKYISLNKILEMDNNIETYLLKLAEDGKRNDNKYVIERPTLNENFRVNNLVIFEMFINEFNDYEEMITVLSKNNYVKDKIKNLNSDDKRRELINLAKKFVIIKLNNDTDNYDNETWKLSFLWHEIDEGILLFNKALDLTLINVQKSLLTKIDNIANSIDLQNKRKKEALNIVLNSVRTSNKLKRSKKTRYLVEQSDIAKELGIKENQFDKLAIESPNYPYYLRGYKAIDKELYQIKSRSDEDNDLMSEEYIEIKRRLFLIEEDVRSKQLRIANKSVKKDNISDWINFNLELSEIKNTKKKYFYIFFSIIVGGILGIFYVLAIKSFRERKNT